MRNCELLSERAKARASDFTNSRSATMLSLGGGGGRLRLAALAHQAQLSEGVRDLDHTLQTPPSSLTTLPQVVEGLLGGVVGDGDVEGGNLAMLEAREHLPQEWTVETITYESVPLISYTPRQLVIDVCAHVKR